MSLAAADLFSPRGMTFEEQIEEVLSRLDPTARMSPEELRAYRAQQHARENFGAYMDRMYANFKSGDHIETLQDALVRVERGELKRLIVTMPPRHSKSMHVSEGFPAWYLGRNPDHRVIAASHTQQLAEKFSYKVLNQISTHPLWPFDEVKIARDRGGVKGWDIAGSEHGGYFPVGVGGSPTGLGADLIIIDDPIRGQEDADSETIRDKLWDWYDGTMYTRLQPGGAIIVTATRWHEDDLTGRLLAAMEEGGEEWEHVYLKAEPTPGEFLWPEFWSHEEYEAKKGRSTRVWNAQYQGRPSTEGGEVLRGEWFGRSVYGERYHKIVIAVDAAEEVGITNDWTVFCVIGISEYSYDVLEVYRVQVIFPDLDDATRDMYTRVSNQYRGVPIEVVIEKKSSGTALIQTLKAKTRMPVFGHPAHRKGEKSVRVIEVTPVVRTGRVRLLDGAPWIQEFLHELEMFPNGAHDDQVDAFTIGLRHAAGIGSNIPASSASYIRGPDVPEDPFEVRRKYPDPPRRRPGTQNRRGR